MGRACRRAGAGAGADETWGRARRGVGGARAQGAHQNGDEQHPGHAVGRFDHALRQGQEGEQHQEQQAEPAVAQGARRAGRRPPSPAPAPRRTGPRPRPPPAPAGPASRCGAEGTVQWRLLLDGERGDGGLLPEGGEAVAQVRALGPLAQHGRPDVGAAGQRRVLADGLERRGRGQPGDQAHGEGGHPRGPTRSEPRPAVLASAPPAGPSPPASAPPPAASSCPGSSAGAPGTAPSRRTSADVARARPWRRRRRPRAPMAMLKARVFLCGHSPRQSRPPSSRMTPTLGSSTAISALPAASAAKAAASASTKRRPDRAPPR